MSDDNKIILNNLNNLGDTEPPANNGGGGEQPSDPFASFMANMKARLAQMRQNTKRFGHTDLHLDNHEASIVLNDTSGPGGGGSLRGGALQQLQIPPQIEQPFLVGRQMPGHQQSVPTQQHRQSLGNRAQVTPEGSFYSTSNQQLTEQFFKYYGKGAKIALPKFDGKSPGTWIWKFKLTAGHNRITESEMCRRVSGCMEGAANNWFLATFDETLSSFPEFKAKFRERWDCDNFAITQTPGPKQSQEQGVKMPVKGTDQEINVVHRQTFVVSSFPPPSLPPLPNPKRSLQLSPAPLLPRIVAPVAAETAPELVLPQLKPRENCRLEIPVPCTALISVSVRPSWPPLPFPLPTANELLKPIPALPIPFEPISLPPEIIPENYLIFVLGAENHAQFIGHSLAFLHSSQEEWAKHLPSTESQEFSLKLDFETPIEIPIRGSQSDDNTAEPLSIEGNVSCPPPPVRPSNLHILLFYIILLLLLCYSSYSLIIERQLSDSNVKIRANHRLIENNVKIKASFRTIDSNAANRVNHRLIDSFIANEANRQSSEIEAKCVSYSVCGNDDRPDNEFPVNSGQRFGVDSEPQSTGNIARALHPPERKWFVRQPHIRFKGFLFDTGPEPHHIEQEARAPPPSMRKRSTHRPHTRFKGFIFLVLFIVFIIYLKLIFVMSQRTAYYKHKLSYRCLNIAFVYNLSYEYCNVFSSTDLCDSLLSRGAKPMGCPSHPSLIYMPFTAI